MPDATTETRALSSIAGFRIGQRYELVYTRELGEVHLRLPHSLPRGGATAHHPGLGRRAGH